MDNANGNPSVILDRNEIEFSQTEIVPPDFTSDKLTFVKAESSEETLNRILAGYEVGNKLRVLRLKKKISLVDLGKHTGLSASMLSQLENGKLIPTLPTLARIAMVFDVGLDYFFGAKKRKKTFSVVRAEERMKFPDRAGNPNPGFYFEVLAFSAADKSMQAYMAEFPDRQLQDVQEHFHDGFEFLHVMEGELTIHFEGEDHVLHPGDSVYFDASEPHSYRGAPSARALVITTPGRP